MIWMALSSGLSGFCGLFGLLVIWMPVLAPNVAYTTEPSIVSPFGKSLTIQNCLPSFDTTSSTLNGTLEGVASGVAPRTAVVAPSVEVAVTLNTVLEVIDVML